MVVFAESVLLEEDAAVGQRRALEEAEGVGVADWGNEAAAAGDEDASAVPPLANLVAVAFEGAAHQHHLADLLLVVVLHLQVVRPGGVRHPLRVLVHGARLKVPAFQLHLRT